MSENWWDEEADRMNDVARHLQLKGRQIPDSKVEPKIGQDGTQQTDAEETSE